MKANVNITVANTRFILQQGAGAYLKSAGGEYGL